MSSPYETAPAMGGAAITKSDTTVLDARTRAIYVGVSGTIKVTTWDGSVLTFLNVPVGFFTVKAKIVWSAVTTATDMIAVW